MAASSQAYMDKAQLRQSYRNVWHTDLTSAIQADFPSAHVSPTCFADVLSTMICQDTCAARGTCHAAGGAARADAQNYALQQRCSSASAAQWLRPGSCCKMSSTYRQPSATIASSASCSASSNWPASAPWSRASSATRNSRRLRKRSRACLTWSTGRFAPVCRRSTKSRWTRGTASSALRWQCLRCSRCRASISRCHLTLGKHRSRRTTGSLVKPGMGGGAYHSPGYC